MLADVQSGLCQLRDSLCLLQLLYRRNKNQHRRSRWWRWFCMLKSCTQNLITNVAQADRTGSEIQCAYMVDNLLPTCYLYIYLEWILQRCTERDFRSFSQLAADPHFSALGLTLVGEIARIWKHIGCLGFKDVGSAFQRDVVESQNFDSRGKLVEDLGHPIQRAPLLVLADHARKLSSASHDREQNRFLSILKHTANGDEAASFQKRRRKKNMQRIVKMHERKDLGAIDQLFQALEP